MNEKKSIITFFLFLFLGFFLGIFYPKVKESIKLQSFYKDINENQDIKTNLISDKKYSSKNNIDFSIKYSNIYINVKIYGMVEKPGLYKLKRGTKLSELLKIAGVKNGAYIEDDREIKDNERVYIKEAINVCLQTDVKTCYILPKGSRLYDLLDRAKIKEDINMPNYFLKDGQTFFISKKKSKE